MCGFGARACRCLNLLVYETYAHVRTMGCVGVIRCEWVASGEVAGPSTLQPKQCGEGILEMVS